MPVDRFGPAGRRSARTSARHGLLIRILIAGAVAFTALGSLTTPAFANQASSYQVQPGDTLSGIAVQYGVSITSLAASNDLANPNVIAVGQVLTINHGAAVPRVASVAATTIIHAPYVSQFDGSAWAQSNCGPANLSMALGALGVSADQLTLRSLANRQMRSWNPSNGTTWESLAYGARNFGVATTGLYHGSHYRKWAMSDLTGELAQGHPVILLVRYRDLPDHAASSYWGDHYIVALGLDRNGNVVYHDSAIHGDGANRAISQNLLVRAWSNTAAGLTRTALALHR